MVDERENYQDYKKKKVLAHWKKYWKGFTSYGNIRKVVGKKGEHPTPFQYVDDKENMPNLPPLHDHGVLLQNKRVPKTYIFIAHEYPQGIDKIRETVEFCDRWGLELEINAGVSWYLPSGTVAFIYRKRTDD